MKRGRRKEQESEKSWQGEPAARGRAGRTEGRARVCSLWLWHAAAERKLPAPPWVTALEEEEGEDAAVLCTAAGHHCPRTGTRARCVLRCALEGAL